MEFDQPPALGPVYLRALFDRRPARMPAGASVVRLAATLAPHSVDGERLARYREVCAFEDNGRLPITYPHVLAAGVQMHMLADPAFPVRLVGLVHVRNLIRQHRAIDAAEAPALSCWLEGSTTTEAGEEFCLHTTAAVEGHVCWEEETAFVARAVRRSKSGAPRTEEPAFETAARWTVPADTGRRYARVSGDYNPIHLWRASARLFGFPGAIAHGMWSLGRCAAALGPAADGACTLEARFRRPLVLPSDVSFQRASLDGTTVFRVAAPTGGTIFLGGTLANS